MESIMGMLIVNHSTVIIAKNVRNSAACCGSIILLIEVRVVAADTPWYFAAYASSQLLHPLL
jgi:hypothetical protein